MKQKQTNVLKLGVLTAAVAVAACAQPPAESVASARAALEQAVAAEAAEYAPAEFQQAREGLDSLDAELTAQQGRFAPMRSYAKAEQLATAARSASEQATRVATAGREQARNEASLTIESLRSSVEEVKLLLEQAPMGKGTAADIEAMKADLVTIESSFGDLERSLGEGRFRDVAVKARASLETADSIKASIAAAIEARKAGRRRG